jgi:hypothetical protein
MSRCVINALTTAAFPVEVPTPADGILLYHQYGFPQRCPPHGPVVIEDIAHAFFATARTGARRWAGTAAVFSLKKFFPIAGMGGGLIVQDEALVQRIRDLSHTMTPEDETVRHWMRQVVHHAYAEEPGATEEFLLDSAYELLLKFVQPNPLDLVGLPQTIEGIREVGAQRQERVRFFRSFFGNPAVPLSFWEAKEDLLPFALPYFGTGNRHALDKANQALAEAHVHAGVYHLDVQRNALSPEYRPCLLLPAHQAISMPDFERLCRIIKSYDQG